MTLGGWSRLGLATLMSLTGCSPTRDPPPGTTAEDLMRQGHDLPIGQTVGPIARLLADRSVLVKLPDSAIGEPGKDVALEKLQFATARDNQGRTWAYAYTSEAEFLRAFAPGSKFAQLKFPDFFRLIDGDTQFAGIVLNAGSDASCPIPREVYGPVKVGLSP